MTTQAPAQTRIIGISQNRSLAGVPHIWDITGDDRAECHMPNDAKLTLRRTFSGQWHLSGHPNHRMHFNAQSLADAIGIVIYRKFATHPARRVRASQIARDLKRVQVTEGPPEYILVPSQSEPGASYMVNLDEKTCTCPDHAYRKTICKHLLAALDLLK